MHVRNVFIQGNKVTQEKVLRRELTIYPGDVYDERQIRRSENRLRNLGYFKRVQYRADPTPALDESDIVFQVEEQRTGSFMVGGGFSSVDKLVGFVEITERNFNIGTWPPKGAGQKLKLRGQFGSTTSQSELSFVEPWLFGRKFQSRQVGRNAFL
jgi:outer membrane protein insertion porin family